MSNVKPWILMSHSLIGNVTLYRQAYHGEAYHKEYYSKPRNVYIWTPPPRVTDYSRARHVAGNIYYNSFIYFYREKH